MGDSPFESVSGTGCRQYRDRLHVVPASVALAGDEAGCNEGAGLQVGHGSGMALIVDGCAGQQMEANILSAEVVVYRDESFANVDGCDLAMRICLQRFGLHADVARENLAPL